MGCLSLRFNSKPRRLGLPRWLGIKSLWISSIPHFRQRLPAVELATPLAILSISRRGFTARITSPTAAPPIGLGAILQVTTAPGGVISAVSLINTFQQSEPENTEPLSGAYFLPQSNPVAQFSTSGTGTGATFNLTFSGPGDQRVILTNQEFAILAYVKQITDPNVMDPQFIDAWKAVVASRLVFQLTGDKAQANYGIQIANSIIVEARKGDGNEGLTINDVTPDWIRIRGLGGGYNGDANFPYSPSFAGFDWGAGFSLY